MSDIVVKGKREKEARENFLSREMVDDTHYKNEIPSAKTNYGICGSCTLIGLIKTAYAVKMARCNRFKIPLSDADPVKECSEHSPVGQLSLYDMGQIAWIIEPPKIIRGFGNGD